MQLVRVHNFSVSLDGFGTGEGQALDAPFGHAGSRLMSWAFETRTFREMGIHGLTEGSRGVDEAFASQWARGIGAEIMGRNKFGPQRGAWEDEEWKGWWGDNPVFHTPVVVLTHHPRPVLEMEGGTTFHFVGADPAAALEQARELAGGLDIRIGGGASTIRQFLDADLVDLMHIVLVPIVLGRGERLWDGLEGLEERFVIEVTPSPQGVVHLLFTRRPRTPDVPEVIRSYFDASATRDVDALAACFTTDALVADDGKEHRGTAAIRDWKSSTDAAFEYTTEVTGSEHDGSGYLVTATITGDFPGSPVSLQYRFELDGDLISCLQIAP